MTYLSCGGQFPPPLVAGAGTAGSARGLRGRRPLARRHHQSVVHAVGRRAPASGRSGLARRRCCHVRLRATVDVYGHGRERVQSVDARQALTPSLEIEEQNHDIFFHSGVYPINGSRVLSVLDD